MIDRKIIDRYLTSYYVLGRDLVYSTSGPTGLLYCGKPWVEGLSSHAVRYMIDDDIGVRGVESRVLPIMLEKDLGLLS